MALFSGCNFFYVYRAENYFTYSLYWWSRTIGLASDSWNHNAAMDVCKYRWLVWVSQDLSQTSSRIQVVYSVRLAEWWALTFLRAQGGRQPKSFDPVKRLEEQSRRLACAPIEVILAWVFDLAHMNGRNRQLWPKRASKPVLCRTRVSRATDRKTRGASLPPRHDMLRSRCGTGSLTDGDCCSYPWNLCVTGLARLHTYSVCRQYGHGHA